MRKLLLLFNPIAGKAKIATRIYEILSFYVRHGYMVTVYQTNRNVGEILEESASNYDLIVCAGGDGTLNQVISSYMTTSCNIPLGYLPMGSTNDFAKTLGYSLKLKTDLEITLKGVSRMLDIGNFNGQYFVYVAAFGSLAEVSYSTSQISKNVWGHLAYILKGIQKITDLKEYSLKIEYGNNLLEGQFCMGLIMNSISVGGFKNPLSDYVVLDDGLFEVLFVRMPHNLTELQAIIVDLVSQTISSNLFVYIQTDSLQITSTLMNWTLDGEYAGNTKNAVIHNCKRAINIVGNFI